MFVSAVVALSFLLEWVFDQDTCLDLLGVLPQVGLRSQFRAVYGLGLPVA